MKKVFIALTISVVLLVGVKRGSARKLVDLIPGLYGGDGIFLATDPAANHTAHFAINSAASINQLNKQIAAEVSVFPFSSSVGGFTFAFSQELGTFVRTTETLGPLFAERAPTLGRGKLNLNLSFTFFRYDEFNGESLDSLDVVARHDPDVIGLPDVREQFEQDTILIDVDLDIQVWILALAATYGLTDRLDLGILIPLAQVDRDVQSQAQVVKSPENTLFPDVHTFAGGPESPNDSASDRATGLGDIVVRAKYHLLQSQVLDMAGAVLTKLATGDEENFLGTGTTTIRPFLIFSRTFFNLFTPHLNIGYEFNIDRSDQNSLEYVVGFDLGRQRFTLAGELLGSYEPDGDGVGDDILNGSFGIKWNPFKQFLFSGNVLFPLNDDGLRSNFILTFGAEYNF